MRYGRLQFSRVHFTPGFSRQMMADLFKGLPDDAAIVGVGSDFNSMTDSFFIKSDLFKEVPDGSMPGDIILTMFRDQDGSSRVVSVDWSYVSDPSAYTGVSVQSYSYGHQDDDVKYHVNGSIRKKPICYHDWVEYKGLNEVFEHCKHCGDRKNA